MAEQDLIARGTAPGEPAGSPENLPGPVRAPGERVGTQRASGGRPCGPRGPEASASSVLRVDVALRREAESRAVTLTEQERAVREDPPQGCPLPPPASP